MTLNASSISIVQWYGLSTHACGYCKGNGSTSHGLVAHTMQPQTYQGLIDRGWRRSGTYCYKPIMNVTCCPMYTIRSDTSAFVLSKSQKKVLKRFTKYLSNGILSAPSNNELSEGQLDAPSEDFEMNNHMSHLKNIKFNIDELNKACKDSIAKIPIPSTSGCNKALTKVAGADNTKPPCKKAKMLRLERKKQKLLQQGKTFEKVDLNAPKPLEIFFEEEAKQSKHKLLIKSVLSEALTKDELKQEHSIFVKYQRIIHNDPPSKCKMNDFTRFLVDTPLIEIDIPNNPIIKKYGSYHQQYWIDNKLIAVGVIDILPSCVSSVYFFYDPDYRDLTLGTYAALREISFVKSLTKYTPTLRYYYMGYYIHSCPKMRYKGQYKPSELACPETYRWQPIESCRPKLDKERYCRLDEEDAAIDDNKCDREDIEELKILQSNSSYTSARHSGKLANNRKTFELIGDVIGKKNLTNILFCFYDL